MSQLMLEKRHTLRAIARSVCRFSNTISCKLARNDWRNSAGRQRFPLGHLLVAGGYRAAVAHKRALRLIAQPGCRQRLRIDGPLWPAGRDLLRDKHSPEQIAGMLARMYSDTPQLRVSHGTIYTAIYAMLRGALRKEVISCLRGGRKSRRPRTRGQDRRGEISNMVSIHESAPEVKERVVPGHWKGDLIVGTCNDPAVARWGNVLLVHGAGQDGWHHRPCCSQRLWYCSAPYRCAVAPVAGLRSRQGAGLARRTEQGHG